MGPPPGPDPSVGRDTGGCHSPKTDERVDANHLPAALKRKLVARGVGYLMENSGVRLAGPVVLDPGLQGDRLPGDVQFVAIGGLCVVGISIQHECLRLLRTRREGTEKCNYKKSEKGK